MEEAESFTESLEEAESFTGFGIEYIYVYRKCVKG